MSKNKWEDLTWLVANVRKQLASAERAYQADDIEALFEKSEQLRYAISDLAQISRNTRLPAPADGIPEPARLHEARKALDRLAGAVADMTAAIDRGDTAGLHESTATLCSSGDDLQRAAWEGGGAPPPTPVERLARAGL